MFSRVPKACLVAPVENDSVSFLDTGIPEIFVLLGISSIRRVLGGTVELVEQERIGAAIREVIGGAIVGRKKTDPKYLLHRKPVEGAVRDTPVWEAASALAASRFVTLCYSTPRRSASHYVDN